MSRRPPQPAAVAREMDPGHAARGGRWACRATVNRLLDELAALEARQAAFNAAVRRLLMAVAEDPPVPSRPIAHLDLPALLFAYERSLVLWALAKAGGRQLDAARVLGIQPTTINEKMKRLGIARPKRAEALPPPPSEPLRRGMTRG